MSKRRNWLVIAVLVLVLIAGYYFSISEKSNIQVNSGASPTSLKVGLAELGEITSLDPARAGTTGPIIAVWHIYDRLTGIDENNDLIPMLASKWTSDDEMKTWRFELRTDAFFTELSGAKGPQVTADDVKRSIERALKIPGLGRTLLGNLIEGENDFIEGKVQEISGIKVDGKNVIFRLNDSFTFFPERLAASPFGILPASTPDDAQDIFVGSGPYRVVKWDSQANTLVLNKSEHWWGSDINAPESLTFYVFNNSSAAAQELIAGQIDWLEGGMLVADLLKDKDGIRVETITGLDIDIALLNQDDPIFKSEYGKAIGQALNLATDRNKLANFMGGGKPSGAPVPLGKWSAYGYEFDLNKAKSIVNTLPSDMCKLEVLVMPGSDSKLLAELLAKQWSDAGFEISLAQGQADFFTKVVDGDYQVAMAYYGPFLPSADQYLWAYRGSFRPAPNVLAYHSVLFDSSVDHFIKASSSEEQDAALASALQILIDDAPAIWLLQKTATVASRVEGHPARVGGMPLFWNWK